VATASAVQYYAIGLVGYSAARIALPVFYAIGRSRIAVIVSTLSVLVNLALSLTLAPRYGFRGLAFATSAAAVVSGVLAIALLHRQFAALSVRHIVITSVKTLIASAAMVAVIRLVSPPLDAALSGSGLIAQSARLFVQIACGVLAFGAGAAALRVPELHALVDKFVRRRTLQLDR
jgi:putative peptidoglycan lipid II flippase